MSSKIVLFGYVFIAFFALFPVFIHYLGVLLNDADLKSYAALAMGTFGIAIPAALIWCAVTTILKLWKKSSSK